MTAAVFDERSDPGQAASALMSAAVHLVLLAVLVFGVQWQNRPPEAIAVELWEPPPPAPVPVVEAPKPPSPPAPAPVVVKPEPVVPKPDIAEKAPPKPKPVAKPEPKPEPRPKPVPKAESKPRPAPPKAAVKPRDEEAQRQIREQLQREQAALAVDRESRQIRDQLAREAAAVSGKAQAAWIDKVRLKIKGNIFLPPDIKGNPEAVFSVVQLPTGEVLSVKLKKSSGVASLDAAIERAVLKSSPLPRPDSGFTPPREFELRYKPLD